ncbi:MAG TPA: LmbE family protein [Jeotgalicoccus sp.]|nr:LmbE family protein [Jeotgalicoccus sp.]
MKYKTIVILAPHTDDAELGCGGSMARMIEEGADIHVIVFSIAKESVPNGYKKDQLKTEFLNSMEVMGIPEENITIFDYPVRMLNYKRQDILQELVNLKDQINPDLVLIPSSQDVHQDHQVVQMEGLRAFKNFTVLGYELPWNHITFSAQHFIKLERKHLDLKWKCLQEYTTQLNLKRSYFTEEFIFGLSKVRGTQIGYDYAEAYEVFRIID